MLVCEGKLCVVLCHVLWDVRRGDGLRAPASGGSHVGRDAQSGPELSAVRSTIQRDNPPR